MLSWFKKAPKTSPQASLEIKPETELKDIAELLKDPLIDTISDQMRENAIINASCYKRLEYYHVVIGKNNALAKACAEHMSTIKYKSGSYILTEKPRINMKTKNQPHLEDGTFFIRVPISVMPAFAEAYGIEDKIKLADEAILSAPRLY